MGIRIVSGRSGTKKYSVIKKLIITTSILSSLVTIGYVVNHYLWQGAINLIFSIIWAILMLLGAIGFGFIEYHSSGKLIKPIFLINGIPSLGVISIAKYPESIIRGSWITILIGMILWIILIVSGGVTGKK